MSSNLRVNNILPSVGNNVAIGTAGGSITLTGGVTGSSIINTGVTTVATGSTSAPSISPTGDSNTGIFFPSPDTVAIAEGGVEVLRINSSGNIGIGTTDSLNKFEIGNVSGGVTTPDFIVSTVSLGSSITIGRLSSVGSDNTSFRIRDRVNRTIFYTSVAQVDIGQTDFSSTNLNIKNGNLVFSTAGTGIDFSATANSSGTMTSELLSDYEEGTWIPTITGSSTAGTGTYSQQHGSYTKIGRTVTLTGYISWGAHTGTGTFLISNLPFTPANSLNHITTGSIMMNSVTFGGYPVVYSSYGVPYLYIYVSNNNSGWAAINIDTSGDIIFGITYITT